MALSIGLSALPIVVAHGALSNDLAAHGLGGKLWAPQAQQKLGGDEGGEERDKERGEAYRYQRAAGSRRR